MKIVEKIKIKNLSNEQIKLFEFWFTKTTEIYNLAIYHRKFLYSQYKLSTNVYEQKKELPLIKKDNPEFKLVPNKVLSNCLFDIEQSYKMFYSNPNQYGLPKYKRELTSLEFTKKCFRRLSNRKFKLPLNDLIFKTTEKIPENFTSIRLKKEGRKNYYLIFFLNMEELPLQDVTNNDQIVGMDLGIKTLATDSNNHIIKRFSLKLINRYNKRIKFLNQSLSTKKKGSIKFNKVKNQLGKAHRRLSDTRKDYIHKESTKYIKHCINNNIKKVVIGNLDINKLKRKEESGRGFRVNYQASSIKLFSDMIKYKGKTSGISVSVVDESYTSKTCNKCHKIHHYMTAKDRVMKCNCEGKNNYIDRDLNGAMNIKDVWLGQFNSEELNLLRDNIKMYNESNIFIRKTKYKDIKEIIHVSDVF